MGKLRILNASGDEEHSWPDQITEAQAREVFNLSTDKGAAAFVKKGNGAHEQIKHFDPNAEEILITRPLMGG